MNKIRQFRGITLLELLLSLTVIAAVILMSVRYFETAAMETKVAEGVKLVDKLGSASYEWLQAQRQEDFNGPRVISLNALVEAGLVSRKTNMNPWGGGISIRPGQAAPASTGESATEYVQISLNGLTQQACMNLLVKLQKSSRSIKGGQCTASGGNVTYSGEF